MRGWVVYKCRWSSAYTAVLAQDDLDREKTMSVRDGQVVTRDSLDQEIVEVGTVVSWHDDGIAALKEAARLHEVSKVLDS